MGMDVIGVNPTSKKGEYFRNNVWWWHPLWEYCSVVAPDICKKVIHAHSNDGDGLDEDDSKALAKLLIASLKNGDADDYISQREQYLAGLPTDTCKWCRGTGMRQWYEKKDGEGCRAVWTSKEQEDGTHIYTCETMNEDEEVSEKQCNVCRGTGIEKHFALSYQLNTENIKNFASFLKGCGGFSIC